MGARELRHDWFRSLCSNGSYERIATGHNADDNEETLLLNLMRGSGTGGLKSMESDNGLIIRPLLHLNRHQILDLIDELPHPDPTVPDFVTDSSNLTDDYRRNFLRHRIIPLLETRWAGIHTALQTTIRLQQEENKVVEQAVRRALAEASDVLLRWETIRAFPSPMTLIRHWIGTHGGAPKLAAEISSVIPPQSPKNPEPGKRWIIGPDIEIVASAEGLKIEKIQFSENGACRMPDVRSEIITVDNPEQSLEMAGKGDACITYFPVEEYIWRHPEKGDRIRIGKNTRKLVSDILKEARVPRIQRSRILMLCRKSDRVPIWIPGIRRGYANRITGKENCIIRMEYLPDNQK